MAHPNKMTLEERIERLERLIFNRQPVIPYNEFMPLFLKLNNTNIDVLFSKNRSAEIVNIRHVLAYVLHINYNLKPHQITNVIKRERTSILYAIQNVVDKVSIQDEGFMQLLKNANEILNPA